MSSIISDLLGHFRYKVWILSSLPSLQSGIESPEAVSLCWKCVCVEGKGGSGNFWHFAVVQVCNGLHFSEPLCCHFLFPTLMFLIHQHSLDTSKLYDVAWVQGAGNGTIICSSISRWHSGDLSMRPLPWASQDTTMSL